MHTAASKGWMGNQAPALAALLAVSVFYSVNVDAKEADCIQFSRGETLDSNLPANRRISTGDVKLVTTSKTVLWQLCIPRPYSAQLLWRSKTVIRFRATPDRHRSLGGIGSAAGKVMPTPANGVANTPSNHKLPTLPLEWAWARRGRRRDNLRPRPE